MARADRGGLSLACRARSHNHSLVERDMAELSAELRLVEQMVREAGALVLDFYEGGSAAVS